MCKTRCIFINAGSSSLFLTSPLLCRTLNGPTLILSSMLLGFLVGRIAHEWYTISSSSI
jgi:hypothetical protein